MDDERLAGIIGYFEAEVLAGYQSQPDKYSLETDNFEGRIQVTAAHAAELEARDSTDGWIDVLFGYRTRRDGTLAVAAFLPDLFHKSKGHINRWRGFLLRDPEWTTAPDQRFSMWVQRYLDGSWDVENGVRAQLEYSVGSICALTTEVLGASLFKQAQANSVQFPLAQNTRSYEVAHQALYGYLIDGLNKDCITQLAAHIGITLNVASDKTVTALRRVLPLSDDSPLWTALEHVSQQRRRATHGTPAAAYTHRAFEQFNEDLEACLAGLQELLARLEAILGMSGERARERHQARQWLPEIVAPYPSLYPTELIQQTVGRTIERVEFGLRRDVEGAHVGEAMILHFMDGSILGIDTGSNAFNLVEDREDLAPEDFHASFCLTWVPPS